MTASFRNNLVLVGIGSFALSALAPLPTLAAPGITLQGSFTGFNGSNPNAALTAAGNGIYYGTTQNGGTNGAGSIFKFDSATGSITLQDSFNGTNGSYPIAALTAAGNGIYYGTTFGGGANGNGSIFAFDSATGSITLQGSFNGTNGSNPIAALTAAGNGIYYGTTQNGGANGNGSIFAFDSATGSITLQDSFTGTNGSNPTAGLTAAGNGIYYGTTQVGGTNDAGSIFKFDSATGSITLQDSFTGTNGSNPIAALTAAGNGIYYGTTLGGGANGNGSIFAFDSATGSITLQDSFNGTNGTNPTAALTAAGNGIYYGTTLGGGANGNGGNGSIFAFDSGVPDSNPVPGPLPLMGAGAAFGWSRRLRRRIQVVRPVFPVGL